MDVEVVNNRYSLILTTALARQSEFAQRRYDLWNQSSMGEKEKDRTSSRSSMVQVKANQQILMVIDGEQEAGGIRAWFRESRFDS